MMHAMRWTARLSHEPPGRFHAKLVLVLHRSPRIPHRQLHGLQTTYVAAAAAAMAATHAQSGGAMRVSSHPDGIDNGSLPVVISRGQFPVPWPIGRCPLPPPFPGPNNPMHYLGGHHS